LQEKSFKEKGFKEKNNRDLIYFFVFNPGLLNRSLELVTGPEEKEVLKK